MKKKACKNDKMLVEGEVCPLCRKNNLSSSWQGRVVILDPRRSRVAREMGIVAKGEYAIKVR